MTTAPVHGEIVEARLTMLHYSDLLKELKTSVHLKQNGEEGFSHALAHIIELFDRLRNDAETRNEVKRHFYYEFNFPLVGNYIRELQSGREVHYSKIIISLFRLTEVLEEKRGLFSSTRSGH